MQRFAFDDRPQPVCGDGASARHGEIVGPRRRLFAADLPGSDDTRRLHEAAR